MSIICTSSEIKSLIPGGFALDSDVIVSPFNEEGVTMMKSLRASGDHRPLLFIAKNEDLKKLSELKNCCGGHILPPYSPERMMEALGRVAVMKHGSHCE